MFHLILFDLVSVIRRKTSSEERSEIKPNSNYKDCMVLLRFIRTQNVSTQLNPNQYYRRP